MRIAWTRHRFEKGHRVVIDPLMEGFSTDLLFNAFEHLIAQTRQLFERWIRILTHRKRIGDEEDMPGQFRGALNEFGLPGRASTVSFSNN